MLTHLETIEAPLGKLILGFSNINPRPTWNTYIDTWKMIDRGETDILKLPLYKLMRLHYCSKNLNRRKREQELLNLKSPDCRVIAYTWVEKHVELYRSIKKNGYKPELRSKPISVRIQDDGGIFLLDGTHTVSILMHLGTHKTITAEVRSRDKGWISLKNGLYGIYGKKLLYQPIDHPDFDDWDVDRSSPHRWSVIKEALGDVSGLKVLDVGCMTGWFSHRLALLGAQVTGIEPHQKRCQVCKTLSIYHGLSEDNPKFIQESFENHLKDNHYDMVLVLSVIHHYLREDPKLFYRAVKTISERCDKMILEMGVNRMPIKWSPEIVIEHSKYTKYTTLYDGERPIYLYE